MNNFLWVENRNCPLLWPGRKLWHIDRTGKRRAVIFVRKIDKERVLVSRKNGIATFIVNKNTLTKVYKDEREFWNA